MRFVFASDSYKGSLSSLQAAELLQKAAKEVFPDAECMSVAVADGGEGTTDAVTAAVSGTKVTLEVSDSLTRPVRAYYGRLDENRAVMEMASASGLTLIPKELRDPMNTTSYGTGEMIRAILDAGFSEISIAIGGSATNDGGMGCMRALGVRFLDENGEELSGRGADLIRVRKIDVSGLHPRAKDVRFNVMCDVTNPLCGEKGATMTFGAQKGGTPEMLDSLEKGMRNYRDVILQAFGTDPDEIPGSGAAGGLGAALCIFLSAQYQSGIDTVLDLIGFDDLIKGADLVVTGEGRTDRHSCCGKVLQGIGGRCMKYGVPAVALSGSMGEGAEDIYAEGIESIMTSVNAPMSLEEAISNADELYYDAAVRMFRLIRAGVRSVIC